LVDAAALGYHEKHPNLPAALHERRAAVRQVRQLVKAFPKADWLLGNHDARAERQAITAGIPPEFLRSPNELWECPWRVTDRYGELVIDGVIYTHGETGPGGQDAAFRQAMANFQSTVCGHWHSNAGVRWGANSRSRIFGLAVGCGVDHHKLAMAYGRKFTRKPMLGCGVVVGGKQAYWEPWLLR
jgi:hypothetical protein